MPKIKCICNYIIGLGEIPSEHQFLIISDVDYDKLGNDIDPVALYQDMTLMVKCPNCGRLHIFWNGFDNPQVIYNIE